MLWQPCSVFPTRTPRPELNSGWDVVDRVGDFPKGEEELHQKAWLVVGTPINEFDALKLTFEVDVSPSEDNPHDCPHFFLSQNRDMWTTDVSASTSELGHGVGSWRIARGVGTYTSFFVVSGRLKRGNVWRRRWDLNPRGTFIPVRFQVGCLKPLGHSSSFGQGGT